MGWSVRGGSRGCSALPAAQCRAARYPSTHRPAFLNPAGPEPLGDGDNGGLRWKAGHPAGAGAGAGAGGDKPATAWERGGLESTAARNAGRGRRTAVAAWRLGAGSSTSRGGRAVTPCGQEGLVLQWLYRANGEQ